jgi:hypothetical protein
MSWKWHGGAADGKRGSKRDDDSEVLKLIKAQTKEMREYKKEVEKQFKEIGGKPAFAGSKQSAAGPLDKNGKKFWSCVGCNYKENFTSRSACRECGAQRGGPATLPPGFGASSSSPAAAASAAEGKAAAAKAAVAAAAAAASAAAAAAKAAVVPSGAAAAGVDHMKVEKPLLDRILGAESYIKMLKGSKGTPGWDRAKVQLDAAEEDLKMLREEQRSARPVAARMQASAAKLAKCREAAALGHLELDDANAWVKVISEKSGEADAQLLLAESEDAALRAEAGADTVEVQVKAVLESVAQEFFKSGLAPDVCHGVAVAILQVYNQMAAAGALSGCAPVSAAAGPAAGSPFAGAAGSAAAAAAAPPLNRSPFGPAAGAAPGATGAGSPFGPAAGAHPMAAGVAAGAAVWAAGPEAAAAQHAAAQAAPHSALQQAQAAAAQAALHAAHLQAQAAKVEEDLKRRRLATEQAAVSASSGGAAAGSCLMLMAGPLPPGRLQQGGAQRVAAADPPWHGGSYQTNLTSHGFSHEGRTSLEIGSGVSEGSSSHGSRRRDL